MLTRTGLFSAFPLAWLLSGAGCDGGGCDLDTCGSAENAEVSLARTAAELASATMLACRNDDCRSGSLAELVDLRPMDMDYPLGLSPDDGAETDPEIQQLNAFVRVEDQAVRLRFSWWLTSAGAVKRGDLLHVTIMDAGGEVLFDGMAETSQVEEYGGDERCDKPACRSAAVVL